MRSYNQYCALAKALEVVGDRWTLLIVRELLIRGACRYTDLLHGLPGIATNLLVDRLRELEQAGVVLRESAPPPIATDLFTLTARGKQLETVLQRIGEWGAPLLAAKGKSDKFRTHWLALPLRTHLKPHGRSVTMELRTGDAPMTLETVASPRRKGARGGAAAAVHTRMGRAANPDAILTGPHQLVLGLLAGKLSLAAARAAGLKYEGDPAALRRLQL